ncbi:MAG: ribonuclease HI family protein [Candidatus Liptonbacteria bacterium]|nr:ribonuclease HI family protein [Candidatus Liptonbacteria bacterium]
MTKNKKQPEALFGTPNTKIVVHTDGGARGNPGPAAIGVVINLGGSKRKYGERIHDTTNNVAEYSAVIFALKKIKQLFGKEKAKEMEIEIRADSELLVKQMNGIYKIEEPALRELFIDIWNLRLDFKSVKFIHVRREQNKEADGMVNKALDNK